MDRWASGETETMAATPCQPDGEFLTDITVEPTQLGWFTAQFTEALATLHQATTTELSAVAVASTGLVDHDRDDSILYQLSRARENGTLESTRNGLIGISNDMTFRDHLSPKVKSSLCERELSFSDYDAMELQEVLRQRRDVAFKDGAVQDEVIPKSAAWAAQETGDAREAFDYLLVAGDITRDQSEDVVTVEHINETKETVERQTIAQGLADRGDQVKYVAYAVTTLHAEQETPARTDTVYQRYERLLGRTGDRVLSQRWVREHLGSLAMLGIIAEEEINEGADGGQYKQYELDQDPWIVIDALDDAIEYIGLHESITDYY